MTAFSMTAGIGDEETTPELLKNTPSNIARLEDVIEHSEGRKQYLAQTRSPSDGNDVRWYFCKVPSADNELSASVPRSVIVGKGDYFRFGMRDSLALEASFLQNEEELLSRWWREYAECSAGPSSQQTTDSNSKKLQSVPEEVNNRDMFDVEEERVGVPVKGGLYEVDLFKRHCFPVYWNGENRRVLRGHWFARKGGQDWLPLCEHVAEQLEMAYRRQVWHRRTFQPSGLFAARVDLQGSIPGLHALFTGEDDTWEAWLIDSGFASFNISKRGTMLRRGFALSPASKPTQDELRQQKEEEMDDYCSQVPVGHLVFMVHGIGQRLEKSNLVDDVITFRHATASLAERHLSPHQLKTQRILFIPCQWRKGLKLRGESTVDKITLDGVKSLRITLSATVHDVLYYMSPIYCQEIIDSVSNQLNRLYIKFINRNPGYNGKVSIYGHSLGSVLSYDILCHQNNLSSPFPMDWMFKENAGTDPSSIIECKSVSSHAFTEDVFSPPSAHSSQTIDTDYGLPSVAPTNDRADKMTNFFETNIFDGSSNDFSHVDAFGNETDSAKTRGYDDLEHASALSSNAGLQDNALTRLQNEVESLKAKINELESLNKSAVIPEKASTSGDLPKICTPYIRYTKLVFKVDTFFAVGSPLGVFLSLRNIRLGIGKGKGYWADEHIIEEMPACRQMLNIFHPFDPVAYRIEPLVCKEYIEKRPAIVPYHKGGARLHIGLKDFRDGIALRSEAVSNFFLNTMKKRVLTVCRPGGEGSEEDANDEDDDVRTYGSLMMERLTGSSDGRIDCMLQEKTFEHSYLQALGAHTNYWRDHDTALFILKLLYKDIPRHEDDVDPSAVTWTDVTDKGEEQPLTFNGHVMVGSFAGKSKKLFIS